jgi:hypothetical protein
VISGVAAPLVASDGAAGDVVAALVGTGGGRDAALVLGVVGIVLFATARLVRRNVRIVGLDRADGEIGATATSRSHAGVLVGES